MAQLMNQVVGHSEQKRQLLQMVASDHMPSSFIFHGPEGVGKKMLIRALLQVMNCSQETVACGQCSNCLRCLEDKNELIYELKPETKKMISVDQVRTLHQYLSLKSMQSARFVIIDPADKLSVAAANSLLKVLEEAPPKTYFFLVTNKVFSLLATIRSRSHSINFSKLSVEELGSVGRFDEVSISWSDGRVSLAEQLQEEKSVDQLNDSLKLFYSLICESPQDWKKAAPWFFTSEEARQFTFSVWNQALEKRLYSKGQNLDWLPEESGLLSFVYDQVESLKKDINANVEKQLALENFYYQLKQRTLV